MLEQIKYVNHLNEVYLFGENNVFVSENDLRNFAWVYDTYNLKVSNLRKQISTKKIPVKFLGSNRYTAMNDLLTLTEKDIINEVYGKLYVGDWYIEGYFVGGQYSSYTDNNVSELQLNFVTVSSAWIKPSLYNYRTDGYETESGLGYPYGYPYAYRSRLNIKQIVNNFYKPANFKMIIYGPINNPQITIGGHAYSVNCAVSNNEYLAIDSIAKTIMLTKSDGSKVNKFNSRDVESYIFQPIPHGVSPMSTNSEFDFDITLLEERSVPVWT